MQTYTVKVLIQALPYVRNMHLRIHVFRGQDGFSDFTVLCKVVEQITGYNCAGHQKVRKSRLDPKKREYVYLT